MGPSCRCSDVPVHARVRHFLSRGLCRYGHVVDRYPWLFIMLPVLVFGGLGAGLVKMERSGIHDDVNMPSDSQSRKDQAIVGDLFPDRTGDHYDALELNEDQIMGSIIFRARNNASVYDAPVAEEIRRVIRDVKDNVTALANGTRWTYAELCGRRRGACVVTGERLLAPQFDAMRGMGIVFYPKWKIPNSEAVVDLSFALADSDRELKRVGVVRVTFKLRHDLKPQVFAWEDAFVDFMKTVQTEYSDIVFSSSRSGSQEFEKTYQADVSYVWLSLGLVALCTCVIAWGGDAVSTRALLVPMGMVPPFLGVVGAMGLLSLCEVKVVNAVWLTPLLILGIGVTDLSLLMASWSSRLHEEVPRGVAWCVADVAPACGVTSLSLFIAFCVTFTSSLPSVSVFGLYAGVSVMFTYISTMTLGVGCLAVHARRVDASRHVITCCATSPRDQLKKEGRAPCTAILCGGSAPKESYGDQSVLERTPGMLLRKLTQSIAARAVVGVVYLALLAAAIYGIFHLKRGVDLNTIIAGPSYFHDYLKLDSRYFGFSFPVVFVMDGTLEYNNATANLMVRLLKRAQRDPSVDEDFVKCWLTDFMRSSSYNRTTEGEPFPAEVLRHFLNESDTFVGDVVMDEAGENVLASRCYVFSEKSSDQEEMIGLMQRMRSLAADAGFPVFAYHPAFLIYDQRLAMLPELYKAVGVVILVLVVMCVAVFPESYSTMVVIASAVSTVLGTLGLMHFWDVSVSFVSLTHVVLGAGFAVYFSVPVSAAFLQSASASRSDRVAEAASRAAAPLLNLSLCLVIGVLVLLAGASYPLAVLFKILLLTLLLALFHSVFFAPTVLSLIGPQKSEEETRMDASVKEEMDQHLKPRTSAAIGHDRGDIVSSYFRSPGMMMMMTTEEGSMSRAVGNGFAAGPRERGTRPWDKVQQELKQVVGGKNRPVSDGYYSAGNGHYSGISNTSLVEYHNGPFEEARHSLRSSRHGATRTTATPDVEYSIATLDNARPSRTGCNNPGSLYEISACVYCRPRRSYSSDAINHYENWRNGAANGLYANWPGGHSAASSHFLEQWPGRYSTVPSQLYSVPEQSTYCGRISKRRIQSLTPVDSRPVRSGIRDRKEATSNKAAKRSVRSYSAKVLQKIPGRGRHNQVGEIDIVASLSRLDEVNRAYDQGHAHDFSVASLENVHHVACTLSANGLLGSTQSYVTEKFRDIPS